MNLVVRVTDVWTRHLELVNNTSTINVLHLHFYEVNTYWSRNGRMVHFWKSMLSSLPVKWCYIWQLAKSSAFVVELQPLCLTSRISASAERSRGYVVGYSRSRVSRCNFFGERGRREATELLAAGLSLGGVSGSENVMVLDSYQTKASSLLYYLRENEKQIKCIQPWHKIFKLHQSHNVPDLHYS